MVNMKKIVSLVILIGCIFILSGCANKFYGTWCLYTTTPSSLVILNDNVTDEELKNITLYIDNKIPDLNKYDLIDKIDGANMMITIYYKNKDNIETYKNSLAALKGVNRVENKDLNTPIESLIINSQKYKYGTNLNSLYAQEETGKHVIDKDKITIGNHDFYYKNKFLCYDNECMRFLTKSKTKICESN